MSRERADEIYRRLRKMHPRAKCTLDFQTPFQLLIATILSAQSTDKKINEVTPELFRKYPAPQAFVSAGQARLEKDLKPTGFFRQKAKSVRGASAAIVKDHGGEVPRTLEELVELPGVGRKTANVVMGNAFDTPTGVVVDTHVKRVSNRLGMTEEGDPAKIERDLMELYPKSKWVKLGHLLIQHGRNICVARRPKCDDCALADICPSAR
ncbi:MAG: endonuclease III [Thermoanaerobaculia bacterium]|nr:endonuclease III [Thermoanaerobaculia bacterium]